MSTLSLRLPDSLHKQLRELAKREGVSINQLISIDGRTIIALTEDELGTIRVKRYRLVLPGEED